MDIIFYFSVTEEEIISIRPCLYKDFSIVWIDIPNSFLEKLMFPEWENYLAKRKAVLCRQKTNSFFQSWFWKIFYRKMEKDLYREWKRLEQSGNVVLENIKLFLIPFLAETGENYCVYSRRCKKILDTAIWKKWTLPEFQNYLQFFWTRKLMEEIEEVKTPYFVIIGSVSYLFEFLKQYANQMKSLCLILPKEQNQQQLEEFLQDFYEEYGLAVSWQIAEQNFRQVQYKNEKKVTIVDFTLQKKLPFLEVSEGSLWLDMASIDEKETYLLSRNRKVKYISLKRKWSFARKQSYCLDTQNKNRYNI